MSPPPEAVDEYLVDCPSCPLKLSVEPDSVQQDERQGPVVAVDSPRIDGVNCTECGSKVHVKSVVISQLAVSDAGSQITLHGGAGH